MPNHHDWERAELHAEDNARLREELRATQAALRSCRSDAANVVQALDCAVVLVELLIMFLPEGQVLPAELAGAKHRLDMAMDQIRRRRGQTIGDR